MDIPSTPAAPATPAATPSTPAQAAPTPSTSNATAAPSRGTADTTPKSPYADPADTSATKSPTQSTAEKVEAAKRKYKLKVDGAEQELELGDDEVSVRLQKAMAAEKRMQEAAELRKKAQSLFDTLKKDPKSALKDLGVDIRKQIEDELIAEYQAQQLPEHERAIMDAKKEAEKYKSEVEAFKAEQQRVVQEQLEARVAQETEAEFLSALERSSLPKNRHTLRMMAEVAMDNLEHGIELTADQLASEVADRAKGLNRNIVTGLKGDQLISYLGEDVVKEILRHSVEKARGAKPFTPPEPAKAQPKDDGEDLGKLDKRESMREFRKMMRGED